jgi:hypothetical protein
MKSIKSIAEIQMIEILKQCETIVDDSYLKTQDARRILDAGYKILMKCEELRLSRDNWSNKFKALKNNQTNEKEVFRK